MTTARLTLGPVLCHWPPEKLLDFYARIADEAPIDTVYLGEVVCSKRVPFFEDHYGEVADRLERAGKKVVFSSLAEVMLKRERNMIAETCSIRDREIEVNDASALYHVSGRPHRIGPFVNVYNESTLSYLAGNGATHVCLAAELPATAVAVLAEQARRIGIGVEVQIFGRASLAISARCYHARAHKRTKDNCRFVCEEDPDGMPLHTLQGEPFLVVNGIQTLSYSYVNLLAEVAAMKEMGIGHFRLSPQIGDMTRTASVFRGVIDDRIDVEEAFDELGRLHPGIPFANGFWHGKAGHTYVGAQLTQQRTEVPANREPGSAAARSEQ